MPPRNRELSCCLYSSWEPIHHSDASHRPLLAMIQNPVSGESRIQLSTVVESTNRPQIETNPTVTTGFGFFGNYGYATGSLKTQMILSHPAPMQPEKK